MPLSKDSSGLSQGAPVAHPAILPGSLPTEPSETQLVAGGIYTEKQAAAYLKISVRQLQRLRKSGDGPKFFKATARAVRYTAEAIHDFCHGGGSCGPRAGMQKRGEQ